MDQTFEKEHMAVKDKALLLVNDFFFRHVEEIAASYRFSLHKASEKISKLQQDGGHDISYLEFTMLRTRLKEHDYFAPIMAYGDDWYADVRQEQVGEINIGQIYSYFEAMIQETEKLAKKFSMKLPDRVIEEIICKTASKFWKYVHIACQQAVMGFCPDHISITNDFCIRCCEYMGYGSVIWQYTEKMTEAEMMKWFGKKEKDTYMRRDFFGLDFSGCDFSGLNLAGCNFRGCNLTGCSFEGADLSETWLNLSCLRGANLKDSWIPGTKFDYADLKGAVLKGAHSVCKINSGIWMRPDLLAASFVSADLESADFTFSAIEEADFTGANMTGTIFNQGHLDYYLFDDTQKSKLTVVD